MNHNYWKSRQISHSNIFCTWGLLSKLLHYIIYRRLCTSFFCIYYIVGNNLATADDREFTVLDFCTTRKCWAFVNLRRRSGLWGAHERVPYWENEIDWQFVPPVTSPFGPQWNQENYFQLLCEFPKQVFRGGGGLFW